MQRYPRYFLSLPSLMALIWYAHLVMSQNILYSLYLERRRLLLFPSCQVWPFTNDCIRHFVGSEHIGSTSLLTGNRCNQQIAASSLLVKSSDVTRSTVQKAVVVLAAKPVFGPIRYLTSISSSIFYIFTFSRDKLRVVTTALFLQRCVCYMSSNP